MHATTAPNAVVGLPPMTASSRGVPRAKSRMREQRPNSLPAIPLAGSQFGKRRRTDLVWEVRLPPPWEPDGERSGSPVWLAHSQTSAQVLPTPSTSRVAVCRGSPGWKLRFTSRRHGARTPHRGRSGVQFRSVVASDCVEVGSLVSLPGEIESPWMGVLQYWARVLSVVKVGLSEPGGPAGQPCSSIYPIPARGIFRNRTGRSPPGS